MKLGRGQQYVIELGGINYLCGRGIDVRTIKDISDVRGCAWYISDMPGAAPQVAKVETEAQYAEIMLKKRLQETGEFDGQIHLIPHWKKERGKNFTVGFFTSVGFDQFMSYADKCQNSSDSILFFPLYAVLYRILLAQKLTKPSALVFRHDRFADIIIANNDEVYAAMRLNTFDVSEEQIVSLWSTIALELRNIQEVSRIKIHRIYYLNWFDAEPEPAWDGEREFVTELFPQREYYVNGESRKTSFIQALSVLSCKDSASEPGLINLEYCRRLLPVVNILLILGAILCGVATLQFTGEKAAIEEKLKSLQESLATLKTDRQLVEVNYQDTVKFVQDLATANKSRNFTDVIEDINGSIYEGVMVKSLEVTYNPADLRMKVGGVVRTEVPEAIAGYKGMLRKLKAKGYEVLESTFNTEISEATFILSLSRVNHHEG